MLVVVGVALVLAAAVDAERVAVGRIGAIRAAGPAFVGICIGVALIVGAFVITEAAAPIA